MYSWYYLLCHGALASKSYQEISSFDLGDKKSVLLLVSIHAPIKNAEILVATSPQVFVFQSILLCTQAPKTISILIHHEIAIKTIKFPFVDWHNALAGSMYWRVWRSKCWFKYCTSWQVFNAGGDETCKCEAAVGTVFVQMEEGNMRTRTHQLPPGARLLQLSLHKHANRHAQLWNLWSHLLLWKHMLQWGLHWNFQ